MTLCLYAGPVALDNVVLCSSVDVLKGWLDSFSLVASMLGFTCQAVKGFPTFAPCLDHVCAVGGGGVV